MGDTLVPVGGLVTPDSVQPLTTIVPLDPIWVRFNISESQYLARRQRLLARGPEHPPLELLLADDTLFPNRGQIENTQNQVDAKTGTLELQARFPNPRHTLLPGQFGRVRFQAEERKGVILVPQTGGPAGAEHANGLHRGRRSQSPGARREHRRTRGRILDRQPGAGGRRPA